MQVSVPREHLIGDRRVALVPGVVDLLVRRDHRVYIESGAGEAAGFSDDVYRKVGADIVFTHDEALRRGQVVVKMMPPTVAEVSKLSSEQAVFSTVQLGVSAAERIEALLEAGVTAIGFELIEQEDGMLPVLVAMSEIAGALCPIIAGHYLSGLHGGRGIVLGGVPGVPVATVAILGAGVVGTNAAKAFAALGATAIVLDRHLQRLRRLESLPIPPITLVATPYHISRVAPTVDVLVGAVMSYGGRTPAMVSREIVRTMRPRSLIIDVSIDQGGCVETSHPTTLANPTYVEEGIIHYCVPNMASVVARSASYALSAAFFPYLLEVAECGIDAAIEHHRALARGVYARAGGCPHPEIARTFGFDAARK